MLEGHRVKGTNRQTENGGEEGSTGCAEQVGAEEVTKVAWGQPLREIHVG